MMNHDKPADATRTFSLWAFMSHNDDRGHHRGHHSEGQTDRPIWWRRAHRDWRLWIVVGLMLLAMVVYLMTMDEAVPEAGSPNGPALPAAPAH
jgi:hypothetical protein